MRLGLRLLCAASLAAHSLCPATAGARSISLRHVALDLPAAPAAVVSADLDADGREDLLIILAYTDWGSIGEDRVEGLTEVAEVVPAIFDRREARAYVAQADGSYRLAGEPFPLPVSVLAVEAGPPGLPVAALTDEGIERMLLVRDEKEERLVLEPVVADPPVHARSGTLLGELHFVRDVDGDGRKEILLPAADGLAIYHGDGTGLTPRPVARIAMPGDVRRGGARGSRSFPLPEVLDVDGDKVPDLLVRSGDSPSRVFVLKGLGGGAFAPPAGLNVGCLGLGLTEEGTPSAARPNVRRLAFLGDLEGNGRVEAVTRVEIESGSTGLREGLKEIRTPRFKYRFHRISPGLRVEATPYQEIEVVGHPFFPAFQDLDGDGRKDLVTVTLDFSLLGVVRLAATKKISVGFGFNVWAQGDDGRFREVGGQDLGDRFTIDLNEIDEGLGLRFQWFAGDLDGDKKLDFVRMGGGRTITIRRGGAGCRFSSKPDLEIDVDEALASASQATLRDLDGDGRDDLAIVRPLPATESGVSPPVRLDLYLSGGTP